VALWLPALDGVEAKLERGAAVADVGWGHGFSTIIEGVSEIDLVGHDFQPALGGTSAGSRRGARGDRKYTNFESRIGEQFSGQELGPSEKSRRGADGSADDFRVQ
jgi:hypothetical protein